MGIVDGEYHLMDMQTGRRAKLNQIGQLIWSRLREQDTPEKITQELHARYPEIAAETIAGDVTLFVDEIVKAGFAEKLF